MFVIESCQKTEYNALFMMIFIPVSNFGDQSLADNEETDNIDGNDAVPNPEPQEILNAEADADPGNNLIIAS